MINRQLLERFCQTITMVERCASLGGWSTAAGLGRDIKELAECLSLQLSTEKSLPLDVAQHVSCCLVSLLVFQWLPIEQRRHVATITAKALISEVVQIQRHSTGIVGPSTTETAQLKMFEQGLAKIASWARLNLPQPTTIHMAGKDYHQPPKWDQFLHALSTAGV